MAANVPAKLRDADISRFAHRATQLEKFKPIISYWLRFYITKKVISKGLHLADAECKAYTGELLQKLEEAKEAHPNDDAILDEVAAQAYCEQFALEIFAKADNVMKANQVTVQTADTFRAAATFLDLLSQWKDPPDAEVAAKSKYAKYHALRIAKALKAGEDPNLSNPAREPSPQLPSPVALDQNDPDVQRIQGAGFQSQPQPPYQPYVESAPETSGQPSPDFSATRVSPPPSNIHSVPARYPSGPSHTQFPSHRDVSPISPRSTSRKGSVDSVGGGYFPRVNVPTFTAENAAPGLPTAPSVDEPMTSPFRTEDQRDTIMSSDAQNFYQNQPPPALQSPQPPHQPVQNPFQNQQAQYSSHQTHTPQPPPQAPTQHYQYPQQQPAQPPLATQPSFQQYPQPMTGITTTHQGPFRTDEEAILEAQKHAKWAISALNFEDVKTAVAELRTALNALGAG